MNKSCENEGNKTIENWMFRNGSPRRYEDRNHRDSRENDLLKEGPDVLKA